MKGATAEPLVRTTKPPKITAITTMGSSQNLRRTFMKVQSSLMNSPMTASELVMECARPRTGRSPDDPIARSRGIKAEIEWPFATCAHDKSGWGHHRIEQQSHDQRTDHFVQ